MAITARTYYCGRSGGVKKLVNLTGSWSDVSLGTHGIPSAAFGDLFDIEVSPTNGDHVIAVGAGFCDEVHPSWYGIAVSTDGGTTWNVPNGTYKNIFLAGTCAYTWVEVTIVDNNTIYVCGINDPLSNQPLVAKSTDGGLTFNLCSALPGLFAGMDATSIHFCNTTTGVVGLNDYIVKTIDGGTTWTILNGGNTISSTVSPSVPLGQITGIHINNYGVNNINAVTQTRGFYSVLDGSATGDWVLDNPFGDNLVGVSGQSGVHMAWLQDPFSTGSYYYMTGIGGLRMYTAVPLVGSSWNVGSLGGFMGTADTVAAHFFKTVTVGGAAHGFYSKSNNLMYNTNGFSSSIVDETLSDTSPFGISAVWTYYLETPDVTCFLLTDCSNPSNTIITNTDLTSYAGQIIKIAGHTECWIISTTIDCTSTVPVTVTGNYVDCPTCLTPPPACYLLTKCGTSTTIITSTNVSALIGQVIRIAEQPGCWEVTGIASTCTGSIMVTITSTWANCVACTCTPYQLTDCRGIHSPLTYGFSYLDTDTLAAHVGHVIQISSYPGDCWLVSTYPPPCGAGPLLDTITASYTDCTSCTQTCYLLTDCNGIASPIITSTDVSSHIGQVITIVGSTTCWTVSLAGTGSTCSSAVPVTVATSFANCSDCLRICYTLTDCTNPSHHIITDTNVSAYVGSVVTISEAIGCYTVGPPSGACTGHISVTVLTSFASCLLCLPPPPPPILPLELNPRKITPGYESPGCSDEYTESLYTNYCNAVYDDMMIKRYGITMCCNQPIDKWYIKFRLLQLKIMKDPNFCPDPDDNCLPCNCQ